MTPQYSTIRRFDLLCVLKDFTEEFSGDVDTGGVDLNVTFSIVGENPDGAKENDRKIDNSYLDTLSNSYPITNFPAKKYNNSGGLRSQSSNIFGNFINIV